MIVIERKDFLPAAYEMKNSSLADILHFDHLLIESKSVKLAVAFAKGLVVSAALFSVCGFEWGVQNNVALGLTFYVAAAFVVVESLEQKLSGSRRLNGVSALKQSLRTIKPAYLAIVPALFLLFTMNFQCLLIAISNMMEVVGIACGVPLLLFGLIKTVQKSHIGRTHLYVGSASAFGGVALSIVVNLIFSNVSDLSIFSATNYFSDAIAAIYAPNVVLPLDR